MSSTNLSLLSMLKTRMHWQQARQKVLTENVANADTPGFKAKDLVPLDFRPNAGPAGVARLLATDPRHLQGVDDGAAPFDSQVDHKPFEVTPQGNSVSLEDELMQVSQNVTDFQLASELYSEGLSLVRTAVGGG
jgi:flagellar basal-body rod protein FlgB